MNWVIGDVHGMLRTLVALLEVITRHDSAPQIAFVGDYVNRGPESRGVIDLLMVMRGARFVRGNHDDIFDLVLNGESYCDYDGADRASAFSWFIQHGLRETYASYGADPTLLARVCRWPSEDGIERLNASVPISHRKFIRSLPSIIQEREFFVIHAGWDSTRPDDAVVMEHRPSESPELRHRMLWGRYGAEIAAAKPWRRTGYFGHTPVEVYPAALRGGENVPIQVPNAVLLDTGAALGPGGRLSACCVESGQIVQVDRAGRPA